MAIIRTKRKVIKDPHGYEEGEITHKEGKGFHSTSESYESVKSFCEEGWMEGYALAQREYVEKEGSRVTSGIPPEQNSEVTENTKKGLKEWWNGLSKSQRNWLKGAGITAATALTAAGVYSFLKNGKSKDPEIQKAYTESFIDGYFYAQREFSEEEGDEDEKRRDKNWKKAKAIGIGAGTAGLGAAVTSNILLHKANKAVDEELKKGGESISSELVKKLRKRTKANNILAPLGAGLAVGSVYGLSQAHKARKERLEKKAAEEERERIKKENPWIENSPLTSYYKK